MNLEIFSRLSTKIAIHPDAAVKLSQARSGLHFLKRGGRLVEKELAFPFLFIRQNASPIQTSIFSVEQASPFQHYLIGANSAIVCFTTQDYNPKS